MTIAWTQIGVALALIAGFCFIAGSGAYHRDDKAAGRAYSGVATVLVVVIGLIALGRLAAHLISS